MGQRNDVTLTVNGVDYAGWTAVSISGGIEQQAREFTLGITWRWPGDGGVPHRIVPGDICRLKIGGDLVLTGYVFAAPIRYDASSITLAVSGRSLTADLVDCSAINSPGQWRRQSVQKIVTALAEPYGIKVVSQSPETATIAEHSIQAGETAFESIDRLLTLSRLFSTDDAQGHLVIAAPGSAGHAADKIELGVNVLTADIQLDFSGVFSEYRCKGQKARPAGDESVRAGNEVSATVKDDRVTRRRVLSIQPSGQLTSDLARARVEWERENRMSKALLTMYTVQGWRQKEGDLWLLNQIVRVVDPIIDFNRDMLIVSFEYLMNEQGTTTVLHVAPPDGYLPDPSQASKKRAKKVKGKKGSDRFEYYVAADFWETYRD